jgi:RES domain-containing protein
MASRFDASFTAYRIAHAGLPVFDGTGAFRWGGRWTSPGRYVIHAAESYSLALLENMVHFNLAEIPPHLSAVPLRIPADVSREVLRAADLAGWDAPAPYSVSRRYGDRWYDQRRTAVLVVPSVLSPFECNVLIHQEHPDAGSIAVGDSVPATLDKRLRALLGRTKGRRS